MLKDIFSQAIEAMRFNGRRTAITMVGMAWGIATVVLLLAYGAGFGRAFETIFAQFGTNMIGVFPGTTSEQAGGSKAGIKVRFQQDDVERIQETVPGVLHVSPVLWKQVPVQNDLHTLHVGGRRSYAGAGRHHEHADRRGQIHLRRRYAAAQPCRRHRVGGEDEAILGHVPAGPEDPDRTASASR